MEYYGDVSADIPAPICDTTKDVTGSTICDTTIKSDIGGTSTATISVGADIEPKTKERKNPRRKRFGVLSILKSKRYVGRRAALVKKQIVARISKARTRRIQVKPETLKTSGSSEFEDDNEEIFGNKQKRPADCIICVRKSPYLSDSWSEDDVLELRTVILSLVERHKIDVSGFINSEILENSPWYCFTCGCQESASSIMSLFERMELCYWETCLYRTLRNRITLIGGRVEMLITPKQSFISMLENFNFYSEIRFDEWYLLTFDKEGDGVYFEIVVPIADSQIIQTRLGGYLSIEFRLERVWIVEKDFWRPTNLL